MLAVHIESKMIFFYEWAATRFQTLFSGKFCIRLFFCLENGCAALKVQSPLTSGAIWYIKGFPYPVGKFSNTSPPLRNSATAFSCCGLRFWTPNVGRINLHGNQSEPLQGFRGVTSPDSIIAQCLQTSLSRDFARVEAAEIQATFQQAPISGFQN